MKYEIKINGKTLVGDRDAFVRHIDELTNHEEVNELAINKIDAKIINLNHELRDWRIRRKSGVYGLDKEAIQGVIDGMIKEKEIYIYIKSKL